jgi:hypothetical protein
MEPKERTLGTRATIFRTTDKSIPELEQSAAEARSPERQGAKRSRIKATFYLNSEDILAIDSMQSEEFRQKGKKPERSVIVSRAIQALKDSSA